MGARLTRGRGGRGKGGSGSRGGGEDWEAGRLERVTWPWKGLGLGVGARMEGQSEVLVWSSFVRLGSGGETERKMLNGGCECRVGKCE